MAAFGAPAAQYVGLTLLPSLGETIFLGGGNVLDIADANSSSYSWLSSGRDTVTGAPQTTPKAENAFYPFNAPMVFWPTRNPSSSASTVGATLPQESTSCTAAQVNEGACVAGRDRGDPIAKLRMRPKMDTLVHSNGKEWGWVSIFDVVDPKPNDIYGNRSGVKQSFTVRQNLPCVNGPGGGFISGCEPCDRPSATPGRCDVLMDDVGPWMRERERLAKLGVVPADDRISRVIKTFPCPMERLLHRFGEARVPYNVVVAMSSKGGVKDTHEGNFYTCEYRSNVIQNADDLKLWVDALLAGDVAPCCPTPSVSAGANPCWYVSPDADIPFASGMPDDFAAGLIRNFASRVRLMNPDSMCEADQRKYLTEIARAQAYSAKAYHLRSMEALDELAREIRAKDGRTLDCAVATYRNRVTGEVTQLWGPWGDLKGNAGKCDLVRSTSNLRLECGTGLQMRTLPVTQNARCGGTGCPPLVQYQFCRQTCAETFGSPPQREVCNARCNDIQQRTYNQCRAVFNSDAYCTELVAREKAACEQRCVNSFPDYACSSNLCLTPNRCDPITGRCG